MCADKVTIQLDPELQALFQRYEAHTRISPQLYIGELLAKTRPTLQAVVEALDEAGGDSAALAQLFGRKMADLLQQRGSQA